MDLTKKFKVWRHSIEPTKKDTAESPEYPGIITEGVKLAKEKARSILESLEQEDPGTVMFLGGASEAIRTKSTARVFGEEAKRLAQEKNEILVLTEEDIDTRKGYAKIAQEITDSIKTNPDKKFLIDIPLFVKEFSMNPWTTKEGDYSPYTKAVLKKHSGDRVESMKEMIGETESIKVGIVKGRVFLYYKGNDPVEL